MNQHLRLVYFVLLAVTVVVGRVEAQNAVVPWSAFHAGGGRAAAPELFHTATYGQAIVGRAAAGNTVLEGGFLATRTLVGPTTEVQEQSPLGMPIEFSLSQNYPNPFNPSTTILYSLPARSQVALKVYSVVGEEVATLVDAMQEAGFKSVVVDAGKLSSGVYFYRLQVSSGNGGASFISTRKLLLLR